LASVGVRLLAADVDGRRRLAKAIGAPRAWVCAVGHFGPGLPPCLCR
jgi:hypothetical protein